MDLERLVSSDLLTFNDTVSVGRLPATPMTIPLAANHALGRKLLTRAVMRFSGVQVDTASIFSPVDRLANRQITLPPAIGASRRAPLDRHSQIFYLLLDYAP
jgi:hypothetical protein